MDTRHPSTGSPKCVSLESVRRTSNVLLGLIVLGSTATLISLGQAAWGIDFLISVITTTGPKTFVADDFSTTQRLAIVAVIALPSLCWLAGLAFLGRLAFAFRRGEFMPPTVIQGLLGFGGCLVAMAVAEALVYPAASRLLVTFGKCDPIKDVWRNMVMSGAFDSLMAAVLVLVLTRLLQIGFIAQEEAKWTV